MSARRPQPEEESRWVDERMRDPAFRAAVEQELAARSFAAQVRRVLDAKGVDRQLHEVDLARRLGWAREQVDAALSDPSKLTVAQASSIAHALGLRLRVAMEP